MKKTSLYLTILLGAILLVSGSPRKDQITTCGVQPDGANCGANAFWSTEKQCKGPLCGTSSFCCECDEGYSVSDDGSCQPPQEEAEDYCAFIAQLDLTTSNVFFQFVLSLILQILQLPCGI